MPIKDLLKLRINKELAIIISVLLFLSISPKTGNAASKGELDLMLAGELLTFTSQEISLYMAGLTDAMAHSRWQRDRPDETGMTCIYNWYSEDRDRNVQRMMAWLKRHPDKPVDVLMYVLITKDCGT